MNDEVHSQRGSHEARTQDISWLSWEEPVVHGLSSHIAKHIEILHIKLGFFVIEKLEEDIFVTLLFFID